MKKLFTLVCAALLSVSMFAAEPDFESKAWGASDFSTVIADHDGITLITSSTGWSGNFSGTQYIATNSADLSADAPSGYFGVKATSVIDSVEIYWATNNGSGKTDKHNLAWVGWKDAGNVLKQNVDCYGQTSELTGEKKIEDAVWQKIDLSEKDVKAIIVARQIKKAIYDGNTLSNFGDNKTNNILGVRVWLKPNKTIVSTTETLTKVTINDEAISATELASLVEHKTITLDEWKYLTAPVVKFTKHIVIKYSDDSTKESDEVIEKTSSQASAGTWGANATIGGNTYIVYTIKISSYNVNYYDGATKLGTEVVAQNGTAVKHDEFAVKPLYQFINWYTDAELTHEVASWTITSDNTNFYGKWEKAYATSLDIENFVLANGMNNADADHIGDVYKDVLAGAFYAHTDINALDTLNDLDKKDNRNYAFLGLKIKKTAGHLDFNLKKGTAVKIRFGNVGASFVIKINGVDSTLTNAVANTSVSSNKVFEYEASEADALIQIYGCANNKTLVIKQIKINEQINPVTLPDPSAYAVKVTADKGTVTAKVNDAAYDLSAKNVLIGASVELTVAANQGFVIKEVTVNGVPANLTEGKYTFTMPAEEVAFVATFEAEATALDNTNATVKATKVVRNGMLLIEKNGEVYNVLGTRVR